ncbi:MAG TPA: hypothetical protein VLA33_07550 [Gemmatimonadota bacterium]|nr:hypothetical protein [Gemmatimonadota bacterium]
MRYTTASTARAARLLLLTLAVVGLQPVSAGQAAEPASPAHVSPAALLAGPPVPLPVSGLEQQGGDGDGRASSAVTDPLGGEHAGRDTAASACTAAFCPWRASDALARAGRRCSPSTAPPASPV